MCRGNHACHFGIGHDARDGDAAFPIGVDGRPQACREFVESGLVGGPQEEARQRPEASSLLDVAVDFKGLEHDLRCGRGDRGRDDGANARQEWLWRAVDHRPRRVETGGVAAHPGGCRPDRVEELRVGVEGHIDLVPGAARHAQCLAPAASHGPRCVDLVGGTAHDDDAAGQLIGVGGEGCHGSHDARRDRAVATGMDRFVAARARHRGDRVIVRDQAHGSTGTSAAQRRPEGGLHPGDPGLDRESEVSERSDEICGTLEFVVSQLRMVVDVRHDLAREWGPPFDGTADGEVTRVIGHVGSVLSAWVRSSPRRGAGRSRSRHGRPVQPARPRGVACSPLSRSRP